MNKISIIMPVYNRVNLLKYSLLGIKHHAPFIDELIITDDGSEEDILTILKDFAVNISFDIKYVRQERKGFRAARCRNNGVRNSTGDYLIFVDQDIIYSQGYFSTFIREKKRGNFLVAYPIRLKEDQTNRITDEMVINASFQSILLPDQIGKVRRQYRKERYYYFEKKIFRGGTPKPKLRSGVFGIFRDDFQKVNGFDENYEGWGNEDDDLGRRLYSAGIIGRNPFFNEYPIHLYHETFHLEGKRINQEYYQKRKKEIADGDFKAVNGLSNPLNNEELKTKIFK